MSKSTSFHLVITNAVDSHLTNNNVNQCRFSKWFTCTCKCSNGNDKQHANFEFPIVVTLKDEIEHNVQQCPKALLSMLSQQMHLICIRQTTTSVNANSPNHPPAHANQINDNDEHPSNEFVPNYCHSKRWNWTQCTTMSKSTSFSCHLKYHVIDDEQCRIAKYPIDVTLETFVQTIMLTYMKNWWRWCWLW